MDMVCAKRLFLRQRCDAVTWNQAVVVIFRSACRKRDFCLLREPARSAAHFFAVDCPAYVP